uniref:Peptidase S1 domain-containing protein n=1 Tax=Glossina morsitans morsitans TaxID=37546 RepID=A0A1B0FNH6_GLOMM
KVYDIKTIRVIAGTRQRLRRTANVQRRRVQRKILHPDYPQAPGCDIALMQLQTKLDIDGKYRAIASLEFDEYPVIGQLCIAAGWGRTYLNGPCPNDILHVKMLIISVDPAHISLHRPSDYAQAACSGDSGGPLFCQEKGYNIKSIRVIAGTRRRLRRTANVQRRRVQRKILHPEYPRASGCDIALMQLQTKLDIDGKHRAIAPLEFDEYPVFGQHCIAAGWGTIYNGGPSPNDILYVKMVVIGIEPSKFVLSRHSDYAQAACSGDSGGPLFCGGDYKSIYCNVYTKI